VRKNLLRKSDNTPLTAEERRLVLRASFVLAIPLATITLVGLLTGFLLYRGQVNARIAENRDQIAKIGQLTHDLNSERRERENNLSWALFDACVANELQDAVITSRWRHVRQTLPLLASDTPASRLAVRSIRDDLAVGIAALEPSEETDCPLPRGKRPK
jgi:hypothetical protein